MLMHLDSGNSRNFRGGRGQKNSSPRIDFSLLLRGMMAHWMLFCGRSKCVLLASNEIATEEEEKEGKRDS